MADLSGGPAGEEKLGENRRSGVRHEYRIPAPPHHVHDVRHYHGNILLLVEIRNERLVALVDNAIRDLAQEMTSSYSVPRLLVISPPHFSIPGAACRVRLEGLDLISEIPPIKPG